MQLRSWWWEAAIFEDGFYSDAVSRAYYAMFYAARALLAEKGVYPKTHRGAIAQFGLEFVKAGKFERDLFDLFAHAQEEREEADYGLLSGFEEEEARMIIKSAERFVKACERYG